ncbi:hypothetical protein OF83DRAFT_1045575, partial [Amylostereum chailletii]
RYFHEVLDAFASPMFQSAYLKLPDGATPIPDIIYNDPRFYPFFQHTIGAIDGIHIHVFPPFDIRARYRDR